MRKSEYPGFETLLETPSQVTDDGRAVGKDGCYNDCYDACDNGCFDCVEGCED